ncbi:sulfurtransferase [Fulvimarina endophytica]|uniref:Sulfurtransferase n=1 Tax=Fulvimarina endophytica TaxID=2293836 RepID=A0A371X588_9HYPH|nr:rhodanese-like domain-containing protein [Fulvimarina endophytica]RFC64214.1 sulfurtransferase [Fulvimarina endophytica]
MAKTLKELVSAAESRAGASVSPKEAHDADGLILDVREAEELRTSGTIAGAHHVPRGLLEFKADTTLEGADPVLRAAHDEKRPVHVLCASGGRAVLAAAILSEMGYDAHRITGGLSGWKEAGLPVETN